MFLQADGGVPDLHLGEFGQLLLHVLVQLGRAQDGLADGTHRGLSVVQALHLAWMNEVNIRNTSNNAKKCFYFETY